MISRGSTVSEIYFQRLNDMKILPIFLVEFAQILGPRAFHTFLFQHNYDVMIQYRNFAILNVTTLKVSVFDNILEDRN